MRSRFIRSIHTGIRAKQRWFYAAIATIAGAFALQSLQAQQNTVQNTIPKETHISGQVVSAQGPEAGVWVIAETTDLPTPMIKIVVTNDEGRFVLPELPAANYHVWVRGYGLLDSRKTYLRGGAQNVTLNVEVAPTAQAAAQVFPAEYWWSLLQPPAADEFRGAGGAGTGIGTGMTTQNHWFNILKLGCNFCHQLGNEFTRTFNVWSEEFMAQEGLTNATTVEKWARRLRTGVRGANMFSYVTTLGQARTLEVLANWSDRIAAGAVPPTPPRPQGIERNVVITLWDWGTETSFMHDEVTTDKRNPTVNANGPVYASSAGHGKVAVLDPVTNVATEIIIPTRMPTAQINSRFPAATAASPVWGLAHHWGPGEQTSDPHNPMMGADGRLWLTSTIRTASSPAWCRSNSQNVYAQYFQITSGIRQASVYDPTTGQFTLIDTCFETHHLQFAYDKDNTLWFNPLPGTGYLGWLNTRMFDETGDEQASQGWCPLVIDSNGSGTIEAAPWNTYNVAANGATINNPMATRDTRLSGQIYGMQPSPKPGEEEIVWASMTGYPGYVVRFTRGANPPATCIAEWYKVPDPGFGPRGIDVDRNGVVWTALAGSSHLASFDRRLCQGALSGPTTLNGDHCPEGWKLYRTDGPTFAGTDIPADFQYYNWVDLWNTSGLGENMPWATGSQSDSLLMLDPATGEWLTFRVPYPLGFYQRLMDGRIDDPDAGWKGRGLWANYGTHLAWHIEGGQGTKTKLVHFQFRPDPLAY